MVPALPFPEVPFDFKRAASHLAAGRKGGARCSEELTLFKGRSHREGLGGPAGY